MSYKSLSYVVTTYNKLPYLKEVVSRLIEHCKEDEEIVIIDGGSKDGTKEYLEELYRQGSVHQFVSEPDKGEAHGFNKGMLLANGELIKIITDDDAFYYPLIQECKKFMLEHPEVDVVSAHTGMINLEDLGELKMYDDCHANFLSWSTTGKPGWFIGLPLIIRKSALAYTGLFFTGVVQVDTDFSLRITGLDLNIAWCTGLSAIRIENPQSNFRNLKKSNASQAEYVRMVFYYNKGIYGSLVKNLQLQTNLEEIIKKPLRPFKTLLLKKVGATKAKDNRIFNLKNAITANSSIKEAFVVCDKFFDEYNKDLEIKFLGKNRAS